LRAVIISGGTVTDYEILKSQVRGGDTIICADSGYNHAVKMGLAVDIVVGDFDSIGEMPRGVKCLKFPARKDLTDTEIAIEYARGQGYRDFLFLAATGCRLDHTLTNILQLNGFLQRGETAVLVDEFNKIMLTDSMLELCEPAGSIVSLVPLTPCGGVTTTGLEYPLLNAELQVGKGLGVSNVMAAENATVTVKRGRLLVIVARD